MGNGLTHEGSAFINFRDYTFRNAISHGFRWVDIKYLRFPEGPVGGQDLLADLIQHEQFRDGYAGGGVQLDETRHGPFNLAAVTPHSYELVDREKVADILWEWVDRQDLPTKLEVDLRQRVFDQLVLADDIYYLNRLGKEAEHVWAGIHVSFHEFVLIDSLTRQLTLIVAADD